MKRLVETDGASKMPVHSLQVLFDQYTMEKPTLTDDKWKELASQYPNTHGFVPCPNTPGLFVRQVEPGDAGYEELRAKIEGPAK